MTLDHALVERIIREESRRAGVAFIEVVGRSNKPQVRAARTRAMRRIIVETGCSHRRLEDVWGSHLMKLAKRKLPQPDQTMVRLTWLYGPERAEAIRAGNDPATNADIAKWNALGRMAAA